MRPRLLKAGAAALALGLASCLALVVAVCAVDYPRERLAHDQATSLTVVDRHGQPLRCLPLKGGGRAVWMPLHAMPTLLLDAVLAGEDQRFFHHSGVDARALVRAAWLNLRAGRLAYGGSTVTMQLVRLLSPPHRKRSLWRKLTEAVDALRLERRVSKQEILEQYLNRAYFGSGAVGVESAAQYYFARPATALSAAEAVLLAVLPRAPSAYDLRRHESAARARRHHILALLSARGQLDAAAWARIESTPLALTPARPTPAENNLHSPFLAPHFVDYVLAQLSPSDRQRGGIVQTTLDYELQRRIELATREHVATLGQRHVSQAGVVVLDSQTGAVRAMVGAADYFDREHSGQVNITTTPRRPGSALKPFTYALALEQGDTPATIAWDVVDVPSTYVTHNADAREHGPVRYRQALPCSYNLSAVHVAERVGIGSLLGRLRDAGLTTLTRPATAYGAGLTLGVGPVRLVDLAAAYSFLSQAGLGTSPYAIERLELAGAVPEVRQPPARVRLFSPLVSWLTMDMLADSEARRPAFGDELPFDLPYPVAAKTGTSAGYSDNVAIITTRELTVAAWAGNFDGTRMYEVLAMSGAAPLARAALLAAAEGRSLTLPPRPPGIIERPICVLSGQAPGPHCPVRSEHFIAGSEPQTTCAWHRQAGGRLTIAWPPEVVRWAKDQRRAGGQTPD